jgi:hypothetical protein
VHNRQSDGGYALTHSLYDYDYDDGYDGLRAIRVGSFSMIEQPPDLYQEVPITFQS